MRTDEELLDALRTALAPGTEPDPGRVAALRAAAAALPAAAPSPEVARLPRMVAAAAAVVMLVAGGAALGASTTRGDAEAGTAEFEVALDTGAVGADVDGRLVPFGRVVELRSDDLPVLPRGEFYEVWFVADGGPGAPDRISAGTFHPDEDGHTDVALLAAVDPRRYPVVAVTSEPDGAEVLRGRVRLL